jgi:cytochrome c-type biogenesis protein CcmH/NrfF
MKYRFRKSVWGTKKFYNDLKQGQMSEYWKNPTAGYGELMKMDPQLEYASAILFFIFCI